MSFSSQLKKFNQKTQKKAERVFRQSALTLFGNIVKQSPVGNPSLWASNPPPNYVGGSFRANWQASINSRETGTVESTNATAANASIASAVSNAKLGDTIYFTNNLPYALRLEQGWSTQAPSGWVKANTMQWKYIVNRFARGR